ncbi:response regulator [Butyrivibrio proteoclasticus]|uniref:response regulator n=1 Tax=Butyrivibrio proteoclasticus TaxID=43305 RepID=UPI00047AE29E|nr:response regulator [Butyrivibrio proteoclasticus]
MNTKLLLINQGSTFMVDAIENNLKEAHFEVYKSALNVKELSKYVDDCEVFLIYLGDYIASCEEGLVFLKDKFIEQDKYVNVIGDNLEIEEFKRYMPGSLIENMFPRPLDIKMMIEVMLNVSSKNNEENLRKTILLADDDPAYLKVVKSWLSEKYKVIIVNSGMQAITYLAKNTPDLILLDYEMPVTSGAQVLEMIRSESATASIPVFFLTGKDDKETVTKVLSLRPQGYILKTVKKRKLLEQIGNYFDMTKNKIHQQVL